MSIDTSKMSKEKAAALEIAEAGRDDLQKNFAGEVFTGNTDFSSIYPYPEQTDEDRGKGTRFISDIQGVFDNYIDWVYVSYIATLTSSPAISIPCGFTSNGDASGYWANWRDDKEVWVFASAKASLHNHVFLLN